MKNNEIKQTFKGTAWEDKIEGIVDLDDEIEFDCIRCGECCTGRDNEGDQIMLSPLDVYNGSKELGITPKEFVEKYTNNYVGHSSGVVILVLACRSNGDCKFLKRDLNGLSKCKIHKAKPTICAIHPLGIVHKSEVGDNKTTKHYVIAQHCNNSKHGVMIKAKDIVACVKGTDEELEAAVKVRVGWVPDAKLPVIVDHIMLHSLLMTAFASEEERKTYGFSDHMYKASKQIKLLFENKVGPLKMNSFVSDALELDISTSMTIGKINMEYTYLNYDTSKPFLEQCLENIKTLEDFGKHLVEYDELIMDDITGALTEAQKDKLPAFIEMYPSVMSKIIAANR